MKLADIHAQGWWARDEQARLGMAGQQLEDLAGGRKFPVIE